MAASLIAAFWTLTAQAADEALRIAYLHSELQRDGPGLLVRDFASGTDPQILALIDVLSGVSPDILVLGGMDQDAGGVALSLLQERLAERHLALTHTVSLPSNAGRPTGHDIDGDGRLNEAEDRHAFGAFSHSGGMAVLSRFPLPPEMRVHRLSDLWSPFPSAASRQLVDEAHAQRLSSHGHWSVPVALPGGRIWTLHLLHAAPPVFDGPEDRNGHRNAEEIALTARIVEEQRSSFGGRAEPIVLGTFNADPRDGEGRPGALRPLLGSTALSDPEPGSAGAVAASRRDAGVNLNHRGDPRLDTVDWPDEGKSPPGNLRVDYILPSSGLRVVDAGVHWPAPDQPGADAAARASRHRVVWVDLAWPSPSAP